MASFDNLMSANSNVNIPDVCDLKVSFRKSHSVTVLWKTLGGVTVDDIHVPY